MLSLSRPKLSDASSKMLAHQMFFRAAVASPLHILFYAFLALTLPHLGRQPWVWVLFAFVSISGLLRAGCWWVSKYRKIDGSKISALRLTYAIGSVLLAASWTTASALVLQDAGLTADTAILMMTLFGFAALSVPAFSFDLPVLITFLQVLLIPQGLSALGHSTPGLFTFGIAFLFFDFFITFVAVSQHRFMIRSQAQAEVMIAQKNELEELNSNMSTVLNSLEEGLVQIGADGRFRKTASRRAHELLGVDPTHKPIVEVLRIPTDERANVQDWLLLSFSGKFEFQQIAALGPSRFTDPSRDLTLQLRYRAKLFPNGQLDSILMICKDISREVEAERVAEENVGRAEMILQVLKDPQSFREFLGQTNEAMQRMINGEYGTDDELNRELHTLKGSAGIFHVLGLAHEIHMVERDLRLNQNADQTADCGRALLAYFDNWKASEKDLIRLVNKATNETPVTRSLEDFLLGFSATVETTASSLGKHVRLEVTSFGAAIPLASPAPPALRTLIHVFNNAVDHGIEMPEVRLKAGKSEEGLIKVMCTQVPSAMGPVVRLVISDDGGGINVAGLSAALRKRNPQEVLPTDPMEIYQRIFDDSVSSRTVVTALSGYGVGLGAVKAAVLDSGGRVRVVKSDSGGTTIEIVFPEQIFLQHAQAA